MARVVRSLALALVAAYLAAATLPCPPAAQGEADARRLAGPAVHASHDHASEAMTPASGAGTGAEATLAVDAASASETPSLSARCLCGCGERPTAGATPIGVGWAMVSRAPLALPPASAAALPTGTARASEAPVRGVDHVPLAA